MPASAPPPATPPPSRGSVTIRHDRPLEAIPAADWNALVRDAGEVQPFLDHAFLDALHATGCASPTTGWQPRYLTAWQGEHLVGALPLYAKAHSYGEYVFDWAWADAYRRYGRRYYPKLLAAVPFTPVTGPRLLAHDRSVSRALLDTALAQLAGGRASSLHVLFPRRDDLAVCTDAGMICRSGVQFHWTNPGYRDFADFLSAFNHDKRKKVKQERRKLGEAGVSFIRKRGREITSADWAFFYRCYEHTYAEHGSSPYLTLSFFERMGAALPDNVLLVQGRQDGRPIAAALDVYTPTTLWGRYWGALRYVPGLHFEACYYQAIEFCIAENIGSFEGGAQGVHKLARGLTPVITHSAHALGDPDFARAIADFCARESVDVAHTQDELEHASPFKRGGASATA
jgi:predicted N-acyltransferase